MKISCSNLNTFTSKIKFVPTEEFDEKYGINFGFDNRVCDKPKILAEAVTDGIFSCVAGGLTANQKIHMWHFLPVSILQTPKKTMREFLEQNKKLGDKEQNGLIIGGGYQSKPSIEAFKILLKIINKKGIDLNKNVSLFWHSKDAGRASHVAYNGKEDTWYISFAELSNDNTLNEKINIIKAKYEYCYICATDEVVIQDKPIARELINSQDTFTVLS